MIRAALLSILFTPFSLNHLAAQGFTALEGTSLKLYLPEDWEIEVDADFFRAFDGTGRVDYEGHVQTIPGLHDIEDMGELLLAQHVNDICLLQLYGAQIGEKVTTKKLPSGAMLYGRKGTWEAREVWVQVYLPPVGEEGALFTLLHYPSEDRQSLRVAVREVREGLRLRAVGRD